MPRSKRVKKRLIDPDLIYNNRLLGRLINRMIVDGKKSVAQRQVYKALEIIKQKNLDPIKVFQEAIQNVSPRMEVRSRRIGGAFYQVPREVRGDRRISLSIRWLIQAANARDNKQYHTFAEKLAVELLDAYENRGEAVRRKQLSQKQAEANKAFAHFRW